MNTSIRPRLLIPTVGMLLLWGAVASGDDSAGGLLGCWRFDEGEGVYSANSADPASEAELHNVSWVKGPFGNALRFSGSNSYVTLPSIAKLDGADRMTVTAWIYWEGTGQYPNILTGGTWSPGGFLIFVNEQSCSFRMGRPGHRSGVAGEQWTETSAPFLHGLPVKKWVHLAAVFDRPEITTYVNGKKVGSAKWDYPVGQQGDLQVGRWGGKVSHTGLIDDVRIYGRALNAEEVAALANPAGRETAEYQDLGPAEVVAKELVRYETQWATLVVGDNGMLLSLREKGSGRELLAEPQPVVAVEQAQGQRFSARQMHVKDGLLVAEFPRGAGSAAIRIEAKDQYFTVTAEAVDVPDARRFTFLQLSPAPDKYLGRMAGLASDDTSGVCLRSLALEIDTSFGSRAPRFRASTTSEHGLIGHRLGLAAGPREQLIPMLRSMANNESVPKSNCGGPWSIGSEQTRGSYLFANLALKDIDAWIELARRGGFTNLHLHGWWNTLGHYKPRSAYFPNGLDDMKVAAQRIREAGLTPGFHTLTACISTNDPWVTPVPSPDLIALHGYTLAKALSATDTTIHVNELPANDHDVVWSYSCNGNVLRVDDELIRYSGISRTEPYAFLDCERGAFKTAASEHPQEAAVDYLQQRYLAFYPDPKSPLAAELADRIAKVYNQCGLGMIYFDGSEGMRSRYGIDAMRWAIFRRLEGGVTEASEWGHNSWWFHSRLGAWDHPVWAMKRFHDDHIRLASECRMSNLLEPQLGWWAPRGPSSVARGHFPDEMEYFAAKNLAIDGPMSIQGVHATDRPWNARMEEQLTVLGWYERLRLARYFDEATLERLRQPGDEFRLRQNAEGWWKLTPVHLATHRVSARGNGSERWVTDNPFAGQPLRARLEALYSVAPYDDPKAAVLADFADLAALNNRRDAAGVSSRVDLETEDVKAGGRSLRIRATNSGQTARGAWSRIGTKYEHPYFSMTPGDAMGLWVKGDGSGALLNIQIRSPREYHGCISDHYIDLDFQGWRYVELLLRERDARRLADYVWPYSGAGGSHAVYRNAVDRKHISEVNVLLNEIPAGGQVNVLLSPIHALRSRKVELSNPRLQVGDNTVTFPVSLQSGDYIELAQ
ncbi:MAG: LamG domain-containing protein, partial [bacterium]